ncbi:MFS general substrate transporter [Aspergillus steynii IBT 23096]|uniref:MFS general substrate transporter n=1 Tax=Aspergillus steynii IBT 23096 TaxID=1392250 RepID=A0A2I2G465_9EURO|nr:MFS general substrate transporter [Aspergillus steynii IBT 23096]PLB47674.1 MFS general substrate transporter [Aspergillus steynii IBT 23096]
MSQKLAHDSDYAPIDVADLEKAGPIIPNEQDIESASNAEHAYSIFERREKLTIVVITAFTTVLPPLTASIYYPVITMLAQDLDVSVNDINLTITAYLIVQGIAPSLTGNLSDETGRRPALIICFVLYIAGSIGAAVKGNYAVLMAMRCLQAAGISGTMSLSLATVSDIVTSAERGKYTSYVQMGWMVGPTFAPVIGGSLSQYLGWRSIFWFLTIFTSVVFITLLIFLPETSRNIVGNGSITAPRWNMSLLTYIQSRPKRHENHINTPPSQPNTHSRKFHLSELNPLRSVKLFFTDKETSILLLYSGSIYASTYMVLSSMSSQLQSRYNLTTLQASLCYFSTGFGTMASVLLIGRLQDWNFHRHAHLAGIPISKDKQQDLSIFPVELARLQLALPSLLLSGITLIIYTWTLQKQTHLAVPLVFLFFQSFGGSCAYSCFNNLIMDLNREKPGTASAALNLSRCWMGAGGVAFVGPLNRVAGVGWMGVTIAGAWLVFSPFVVWVVRSGPRWRAEKALREEH